MFGLRFTGKSDRRPEVDHSGTEKKMSRFSLGFGRSSSSSSTSNSKAAPPSKGPFRDFRDGFEPRSTDVFVAIMGVTGAGKSTFISLLTQKAVRVGHNLQACTQEVEVYQCKYSDTVNVYLVDTPGFDDTNRSDTEVLREIATWLTDSFVNKVMLNGIIYLHRITDRRMQGSAKKNFRMFKQLCGEEAAKNVILATTMWEEVAPADGEKREAELIETQDFWGYMIAKGSQVHRHMNTVESAMRLIDVFATAVSDNVRVALRIQNEMVGEKKGLDETAAGKEVQSEILKERKKWRKEFEETKREMKEALAAKDKESMKLLREEQHKLKAYMTQSEHKQNALKISMEKMHAEKYRKLEKALQDQQAHAHEMLERQQKESEERIEQQRNQHSQELAMYYQRQEALERRVENQRAESLHVQRQQHEAFMRSASAMQETHARQLDGLRYQYEVEIQNKNHNLSQQLVAHRLEGFQHQKAMEKRLQEQQADGMRAQQEQHYAFMQTLNTLKDRHAQQLDAQCQIYESEIQQWKQNSRSGTPSPSVSPDIGHMFLKFTSTPSRSPSATPSRLEKQAECSHPMTTVDGHCDDCGRGPQRVGGWRGD